MKTKPNRFMSFVRSLVISFEFLSFLLIMLFWGSRLPFLIKAIPAIPAFEFAKYSFALPLTFFLASLGLSASILRPFEGEKLKVFLNWPRYVIFKDKFYISLIYQFLGLMLSLWGFCENSYIVRNYILILGGPVIAIIALISNYLSANIGIKNIFDLNYKE